jgi:hypothetical protein
LARKYLLVRIETVGGVAAKKVGLFVERQDAAQKCASQHDAQLLANWLAANHSGLQLGIEEYEGGFHVFSENA